MLFYGDHLWTSYFKQYFDEYAEFETADTRDIDSLDSAVRELVLSKLDNGSNFKLLVAHIIGVDSSGHNYNSKSLHLQRKLKDSQALIADIITRIDDKTTLLVFGDHGMTKDGNHGGDTAFEISTVLFAY